MIAYRWAMLARRGKRSLIRVPATLVAIARNGPRTSAGASGLGSHISSWLGPPTSISRMQLWARPALGAATALPAHAAVLAATAPVRRKARRVPLVNAFIWY